MAMIKLTDYSEEIIERGTHIRCKAKYPYEDVVDFMLCESPHTESYLLMVVSGYKAGLTFCILPKESIPEGTRMGCSTKWLVEN